MKTVFIHFADGGIADVRMAAEELSRLQSCLLTWLTSGNHPGATFKLESGFILLVFSKIQAIEIR
jgi:hypothetical protein